MEFRSTVGWAFIVFGTFFAASLAYLWPQMYTPGVFNSRMSYHLVLDIEDFWTCNKDFKNFVIDEPPLDEAIFQVFIFNITNAASVIQEGYKPNVNEVGPYAYQKKIYKYDIYFAEEDQTRVQFKEYSMLIAVPPEMSDVCERMYHVMGRSYASALDPCVNSACLCRNHDDFVTVVNPLFLKMIWEESAHSVLAYFAVDVFSQVKTLIENDFVQAAKAHLVPYAIGEIYQFRWQLQAQTILQAMVNNLKQNYTIAEIAQFHSNHTRDPADPTGKTFINLITPAPTSCNLKYTQPGMAGLYAPYQVCPIDAFNFDHLLVENILDNDPEVRSYNMTTADIPSSFYVFKHPNSEISFLDPVHGAPGYIALAWHFNILEFNSEAGHTMFNSTEAEEMMQRRTDIYATMAYGSGYTRKQFLGARIRIMASMKYLAETYTMNKLICKGLVYNEFATSFQPVSCNAFGVQCVWQWGYMKKYHGTDFTLSEPLILSLIDIDSKLNTNPINIQYLGNSGGFYNSHIYCTKVYAQGMTDPCYDLEFTARAALVRQPGGLFAVATGIDLVNATKLAISYSLLSKPLKDYYFNQACNMSSLLHEVYPTFSTFHDKYVIRYLNKYRDVGFTHTFTEGNWKEIGWAQFGGGFITDTLTYVRSTYQVVRDGMWHFGPIDLWNGLIEYGAWAIKSGYPQAWIYNPYDAGALLAAMADKSAPGVAFRRHVAYTGTTFVGDGIPSNYVNGVGDVGELAFTAEANRGDFSCTGIYQHACSVLNTFFNSSAAAADQVDALFQICKKQVFAANPWVVNCATFETSMTSPQQGIQVSHTDVYGHLHPHLKSRGNVIYQMMFSLTTDLKIKQGLWCLTFAGCTYTWGGMFSSSSVRNILFNGYTEPSLLQFLNMKHEQDGIEFQCKNVIQGSCGKTYLKCDDSGVVMLLPGGGERHMSYSTSLKDEFFAPYLELVAGTDELIWEHSMNATKRARAHYVKHVNPMNIVRVRNPYWAAYPAWDTDDVAFHKYFQCQKRTLGGLPNQFNSCFDMLNTGKQNVNDSRNQIEFYGNDTIYFFQEGLNVNGSTYMQNPMSLWDGFMTYNYTYQGRTTGSKYFEMISPRVFYKLHSLSFQLNQNMFIYDWQKNVPVPIPIPDTYTGNRFDRSLIVNVRRFV